jgi:hypothetical protein
MIAFYYLLQVGKFRIKGSRNSTKQTVQIKYEDVSFFKKNTRGQLRCLPRDALAEIISAADCAALKLDDKKMGRRAFASTTRPMATNGIAHACPCTLLYPPSKHGS